MGFGLLLVAVLGGPLAAVGRLPGMLATTAGDVVFAIGLAATQLGIALFCAFTWRVFRSDSLWATLLLLGVAGALGAEWLGLLNASSRASTMEEILPHTRPWAIAIVVTLAVAFAWTGSESFAALPALAPPARPRARRPGGGEPHAAVGDRGLRDGRAVLCHRGLHAGRARAAPACAAARGHRHGRVVREHLLDARLPAAGLVPRGGAQALRRARRAGRAGVGPARQYTHSPAWKRKISEMASAPIPDSSRRSPPRSAARSSGGRRPRAPARCPSAAARSRTRRGSPCGRPARPLRPPASGGRASRARRRGRRPRSRDPARAAPAAAAARRSCAPARAERAERARRAAPGAGTPRRGASPRSGASSGPGPSLVQLHHPHLARCGLDAEVAEHALVEVSVHDAQRSVGVLRRRCPRRTTSVSFFASTGSFATPGSTCTSMKRPGTTRPPPRPPRGASGSGPGSPRCALPPRSRPPPCARSSLRSCLPCPRRWCRRGRSACRASRP